jgi:tRNA threonylcarbamoyladenosine biosynthesis protein TsaE
MNAMADAHTPINFSISYTQLEELDSVAAQVLAFAGDTKIWLLAGEMGVGKTTLVKAIGRRLGVQDPVQSPTYALVNQYTGTGGILMYHFDFYRIRHENEALDMGVEEYFDSGHYCLVEWPSKIPSLVPAQHLAVAITLTHDYQRTIHLSRHGQ